MAEKKVRRKFTPEQKAAILRRHLKDKVPVSDLCDEYRIQPSMFYDWQKQALENLAGALENGGRKQRRNSREDKLEVEVARLSAKLAKKDNVIAEVSEAFVELKKELGEP